MKLLGKAGCGQLAKMVNQICIAGLVQGLSEGINFGMKAGLNMEDVIEVISKGAAQSWQMENRYKTMIDDKFDFGFAVDWMRKDLKIAMDEAKNNGSLLPVTELVDMFYGEVQGLGGNRWDTSSLIKRLESNVCDRHTMKISRKFKISIGQCLMMLLIIVAHLLEFQYLFVHIKTKLMVE